MKSEGGGKSEWGWNCCEGAYGIHSKCIVGERVGETNISAGVRWGGRILVLTEIKGFFYWSMPSVNHPAHFFRLMARTCFVCVLLYHPPSQGAVQSLRIVAAGIAGVAYGQIFSLGVSEPLKKTLGFLVPGLALFCSAGCSLCGLAVSPPTGKMRGT